MPDPDLQIMWEGGGHPDPEIKGGGGSRPQKKVFWPLGPQFGLTIREKGGCPSPGSTTILIIKGIVKKLHAASGCHSFISSVGKIGQH